MQDRPIENIEEIEQISKIKVALELNNNNVVVGYVYLASEDYTNLMVNDNRFTLADVENINDIIPFKTKYENEQLVPMEDYCQEYYTKQSIEEQRQLLQQVIEEINQWFNEYDMQIKQYERDNRLGIVGTYHIGNDTYSIQELDQTASQKASQINNLRQQLNNLH